MITIRINICFFLIESLEEKLIGGNEATVSDLTYIALLKHIDRNLGIGFVISALHIISAAQCLEEIIRPNYPRFRNYYAIVGNQNKSLGVRCFFYQVEIHENYIMKSRSPPHDIGVITVDMINN